MLLTCLQGQIAAGAPPQAEGSLEIKDNEGRGDNKGGRRDGSQCWQRISKLYRQLVQGEEDSSFIGVNRMLDKSIIGLRHGSSEGRFTKEFDLYSGHEDFFRSAIQV